MLGSALIDYLRTFIEAVEYKLGVEGVKEPELLTKKRNVGDDVVYGPVNMSATLIWNLLISC